MSHALTFRPFIVLPRYLVVAFVALLAVEGCAATRNGKLPPPSDDAASATVRDERPITSHDLFASSARVVVRP